MKRILITAILTLLAAGIFAAEENDSAKKLTYTVTEYEVYDVIAHEDLASNILLGWGIGSMAAGAAMVTNENEATRAFGVQNVLWGGVDAGIAIWLKTALNSKKENDPAEEAKWFRDLLGWNFLLDIAYMGIGGAMIAWGDENVRGHGTGVLCQGAFLFMFDGINWAVSKNLGERYKDPEQEDKGIE